MENTYNFRIRLKELREKKHLSQYKLADELSISQSAIGSWEAGTRECNFTMLIKISKYFGVTIDYLLGVSDAPYGEKTTYNIELAPEEEDERKMLDLYRTVKQKGGGKAVMQFLETLEETLKNIKGEN